MIQTSTQQILNQKLNIVLSNTNKALKQVLEDNSKSEMEVLFKNKDLKSVLTSLFKQTKENETSNKQLLELVKNNPTLKSLKNLPKTISDIKKFVNTTKTTPILKPLENILQNIDIKKLEQTFKFSGVFLESNLKQSKDKNSVDEILTKDLKAIVLKTTQDVKNSDIPNKTELLKHLDKLSLQIDNQQLISYLSNSSCLYLPFSWEGLEDGDIELKKLKDEKFYCDINLNLKRFNEVNIKLMLYEKNKLNIHFYSQSDEFKNLVKENLSLLRRALIDINIQPSEIRLFDKKTSPYQESSELKMGFEVVI